MTEKNIEIKSSKSYLILSIVVLITGMILFYYYSDVRLFYRVIGMISVVIFSAFIAYQSDFGKLVYSYVTDSKVELIKLIFRRNKAPKTAQKLKKHSQHYFRQLPKSGSDPDFAFQHRLEAFFFHAAHLVYDKVSLAAQRPPLFKRL